jgi:RimJ/RimL family protein N-acetyltransferase
MMLFNTKRTYVRPFIEDDLDAFMIYRNDMEWMKYQGFKGLTKEAYKQALIKDLDFEKGSQLAIISKETNLLIGDFYLLIEEKSAWVGYTISPQYAKKGYAFEVVSKMIDWLIEKDLQVFAGVSKGNEASIQLLNKLGFIFDHSEEEDYIYKL